MYNQLKIGMALLLFSSFGFAGELFAHLPDNVNPSEKYVFYSHGYIVEGDDLKPIHEKWGVYNFPEIKEELLDSEYKLIATHRAAKTNPFEYAEKLTEQVNQLIENGVPSKNIFLVGFSRGGFITAITSNYLQNKDVNFVILAACTSGLATREDITIYGHLFSIYETSDSVGSCDDLVARSGGSVTSYEEISISTGKEHGAFYRPIPEWVLPVKNWIKSKIADNQVQPAADASAD
jgi:hypothetical protein